MTNKKWLLMAHIAISVFLFVSALYAAIAKIEISALHVAIAWGNVLILDLALYAKEK
jgi:hypothetical protein